jgi:superfamily II DNA or RNA helicase
MSIKIIIDHLTEEQRIKIDKELSIRLEPTKYINSVRYMYPHKVTDTEAIIPFAFAVKELGIKRPVRKETSKIIVKFEGELRDEQKVLKAEAIEILNKTGSVIISAYASFGKTICSISIATSIKLKTLIVVNKIILMEQWKLSILKFCPDAKVQLLTTKSDFDDECDFYIINGMNIVKKPKSFFENIGLVIVDELHQLISEKLSAFMNHLHPRYIIGLSATAYRNDQMNMLIPLYYGNNKIVREIWHKHIVYKVNTEIPIKGELGENGKVNWGSVLDGQAENEERNDLIVNIVKHFKDRNFLILVKRVKQGKILVKKLTEIGEYVTSLLGNSQVFDKEARILVATSQKCSTGFDHPKLDSLLLAVDCRDYFTQALFRVFRRRDIEPIIFDILDSNPILFRHYLDRREIYLKHGGIIQDFFVRYPKFRLHS